jgi:TonB family protein
MKTFLRFFLLLLLLIFTLFFNIGIIDIRIEEINFLLGKMATMDDISNSLGIIGKYELIKKRMTLGEEHGANYEFEAKIQALISGDKFLDEKEHQKKKIYRAPVLFILNSIRFILGKEAIKLQEENKILNVIEIAYFWERNRRYQEAIKIYDDVILQQNVPPEIKAAVILHKAFCHSMLSEYEMAKRLYERVISLYPNTDAGIISWKLLDFINSMEEERSKIEAKKISYFEKAKQFYMFMDYRNAIKFFLIFLQEEPVEAYKYEAIFFKGRAHEELGENDEAIEAYRKIIKEDKSKIWAKQANRRMLMMGEFYEQKKQIAEEAKRQLAMYQDQNFINNVQKYSGLFSESSLRKELMKDEKQKKDLKNKSNDSLLALINKIGSLDLTGEKEAQRKEEIARLKEELAAKGNISASAVKELERRRELEENPYRKPSVLKQIIDENSVQLKYIYNRKLRQGIKISGKIIVELTIKPNGSVYDAKIIRSNVGDRQFEEEITKQIKLWKFKPVPEHLGDLTVNYPFEFYEEE